MRPLALILGLGSILGCVLWLSVGRLGRPTVPEEVAAAPRQVPEQVSIADALSMPIFAERPAQAPQLAQAPQAAAQSDLRLLGVSYTPRRRAAFVSFGGQPFWLSVGQTRDGVTLSALRRSDAEFQVNGVPVHLEIFRRPVAPTASPPPEQPPPASSPPPRSGEPASAPPGTQPSPLTKAEPGPPKPNNG